MTNPDPAGAWPDELDAEILAGLRGLHTRLDPPPAGMAEQMMLALAVADLDAELAVVSQEQPVGSGARAPEQVRTITFDAVSLTVMVTVVERADERVRLDGWLAPPAALRVELTVPGSGGRSSFQTTADDSGRFVFPAVPRALVWLVVHCNEDEDVNGNVNGNGNGSTVVTPAFTL